MKKFASLLLALVMCLCCLTTAALAERAPVAKDDLKIGFIFLHDENSTYDLNFITAAKAACEKLGIAYETKTNIPEGQECYDAAAELADAGCDIIFADSFGHESYMIQAALEFPEVEFCHATGTIATGSVELSAINEQAAAAGTAEKLEEVKAALAAGTIKVFDTTTFTVNGEALTSYLADVDDMGDFVGDTEVVIDGEFKESFFRAAPYFDLNIDGITLPEGM